MLRWTFAAIVTAWHLSVSTMVTPSARSSHPSSGGSISRPPKQTVKLRTRVTNANGTTTRSVRSLTLQ